MKKQANHQRVRMGIAAGLALLLTAAAGQAGQVRVTVTNLAPANGTRITPVWVGFHDGSFDAFNTGSPASSALEMLAEDGDTSGIMGSFTGASQGTILGPVTAPTQPPIYHPGESASMTFTLDPSTDLYFSFLNMVIPSNDAFIGNDDPLAYQISSGGSFQDLTIDVYGSMVWDAGTEVNDEIAMNTPLLGQMAPNTGITENGMVQLHPGFVPGGNILTPFPHADFTAQGYQVARIDIQAVPAPTSLSLLALGIGMRQSTIPRQVLAVVYLAVGGALGLGSLRYYGHLLRLLRCVVRRRNGWRPIDHGR